MPLCREIVIVLPSSKNWLQGVFRRGGGEVARDELGIRMNTITLPLPLRSPELSVPSRTLPATASHLCSALLRFEHSRKRAPLRSPHASEANPRRHWPDRAGFRHRGP